MVITFYRLREEGYESVARIKDGEVVEGQENIEHLSPTLAQLESEDEVLERFNGPYLVAARDGEEPAA
jgi:hypothetical protein